MRRALTVVLALVVLAIPVSQAQATALSRQVVSQRACLIKPTAHGNAARLTICGANYTSILLGVNARRELYPVAVGVHRALHRPIEACRCAAGKVLQKDQVVMTFTRRRFREWWGDPKTRAGHHLKGCLKNAAMALGGYLAVYLATGHWDDAEAMWLTGVACGVGSVVDA
jgi:hypothetical protein